MPKITQRDAVGAIERRESFRTHGSLTGARAVTLSDARSTGMLPDDWRKALELDAIRAKTEGKPLYIVRSYATPIAWAVGADPVVPDVKYSVTTSKHQGIARRALFASR